MPIALTSFAAPGGRIIRKGDDIPTSDPVFEGRGHLFNAPAPAKKRAAKRRVTKKG